jgi:predicted nucleotidyltransferase
MTCADRIRTLIAREAARLMYEEGVKEYRDAKRKAARRFGSEKALSLGSHLPSNAEIHAEVARLIALFEGRTAPERLLRLRLAALRWLELLAPFQPLLVGSVLSGSVTERSDIDLHLFADSPEEVEDFLRAQGIPFTEEVVTIRHGGEFYDYPHLYLEEDGTEVECTIYPPEERRRAPKSSITGRAMARADSARLKKLIAAALQGKGG